MHSIQSSASSPDCKAGNKPAQLTEIGSLCSDLPEAPAEKHLHVFLALASAPAWWVQVGSVQDPWCGPLWPGPDLQTPSLLI